MVVVVMLWLVVVVVTVGYFVDVLFYYVLYLFILF